MSKIRDAPSSHILLINQHQLTCTRTSSLASASRGSALREWQYEYTVHRWLINARSFGWRWGRLVGLDEPARDAQAAAHPARAYALPGRDLGGLHRLLRAAHLRALSQGCMLAPWPSPRLHDALFSLFFHLNTLLYPYTWADLLLGSVRQELKTP